MYRSRTTVSIGFDATPGTLEPLWTSSGFTWTDVSDWVHGYEAVRGSEDEFAGVTPGEGSVVLDNLDGRFDPSNSGSPYAGDLRAGKPIKITETINLLTRDLSTGNTVTGLTAFPGSALAVSTSQARSATSSIQVSAGTGFRTATGTSGIVVYPGEPLTAAVWMMRTSATGRAVNLQIRFYDAGGTFLSTATSSSVTSSGSWQQVSVQTTAPAGAAFAALFFNIPSGAVGDVHYFDDLLLVPAVGDEALTWFPGGPIDVFRGQIDRWLPRQEQPHYSTTTVSFSGHLLAMSQRSSGESLWSALVTRSKPDLWWRLGESSSSQGAIDSSGNGQHGTYRLAVGSTPLTFTQGLVEQDSNGAVNFDATWRQHVEGRAFSWTSGTYTVALMVQAYQAASACTLIDSSRLTVTMSATGDVTATALGVAATTSGFDLRDGEPHLLWITVTAGGSVTLNIDLAVTASASGIFTASRTNLKLYLARDQAGTVAQYATVTLDEFAIWQGVNLDPTWFYLAARACGIRPADTVGRPAASDLAAFLFDLFGYPQPDGATPSPADWSPVYIDRVPMASLIEMLNIAATLGHLLVYEAADGTPTATAAGYVPSVWLSYITAPVWGNGAGEYRYVGNPMVDYGEDSVINVVSVQRPDESAIIYRNESSVDAIGERATAITVWSTFEWVARELADWILYVYGSEGRRVTEFVPLTRQVDSAQMALWLDIGDVFTINDYTVDGRTVSTVVRLIGKTVTKTMDPDQPPVLDVTFSVAPVRVQPALFDDGTYGGIDNGGVFAP